MKSKFIFQLIATISLILSLFMAVSLFIVRWENYDWLFKLVGIIWIISTKVCMFFIWIHKFPYHRHKQTIKGNNNIQIQ